MTHKRKTVAMHLAVKAPAGMPADAVRREVMTRINDLTGCYSAFDLRLSDRAEGPDGNLRIRAAKVRRSAANAGFPAASPALLSSLRAILPYAESRAEDMLESADEAENRVKLSPNGRLLGGVTTRQAAADSRAYADKAVAAVDAAKALLASLDGNTLDAANASEGAANG